MRSIIPSVLLAGFLGAVACPVAGQSPLEPPDAIQISEARSLVQSMIDNPRGPYSRIRWYCNDGSVLPPQPSACRERGGGRQHAEYSPERERLAALGWSVGTIIAALDPAALADDASRRQRLRELSLERYLIDIDDGWVLRRARNYRGRTQIEDEESIGTAILRGLLSQTDWVRSDFLLARESVRVIPHLGGSDDVAREVRREAIEIVALDRSFEPLRAEIHGAPGPGTAARVRQWASSKPADLSTVAITLAGQLDLLYGAEGRRARMERHRSALEQNQALRSMAQLLDVDYASAPKIRMGDLSSLAVAIRERIESSDASASVRLRLFDLMIDLEAELGATLAEVLAEPIESRTEAVRLAQRILDAAYGTALLTARERSVLADALVPLIGSVAVDVRLYVAAVDALRRVPHWAAGSVRHAFAEPIVRYTALDPRAAAFVDDLLRGSVLVGLGEVTRALSVDVAALTGVGRRIGDREGATGVGLNPGIARGVLRVFETDQALRDGVYGADDIVVLPETTPELRRVAGIVTLGEGNPLSHVQLLARNFGIPNIAITGDAMPLIAALRDREVVAAVATDGSLMLLPAEELQGEIAQDLVPSSERRASLRVPPVDLDVTAPIPLADLGTSLSGRVVGPKAANLGELARLFPGRVAPALAIPFGFFEAHVGRSPAGADSLRARLVTAYAEWRAELLNDTELGAILADIRADVAGLVLEDDFRASLEQAMQAEFGMPGTYGIFVRSDTNVEDLPEFTGAGLSETIANVIGVDRVVATVPRVWASVLSPRAIEWRSNLLENPESVYASVLLMQSVPSTKSGVMVTTNLVGEGEGLTVAAAWGVGGGVGGEPTESLVLHPDGSVTFVSSAKSAYQRALADTGGVRWLPAAEGQVLTAAEQDALRTLAADVLATYEPVLDGEGRPRPWDIEYGFVDGELTLFQIRPLVERQQSLADRAVAAVLGATGGVASVEVDLGAPLCAGNASC